MLPTDCMLQVYSLQWDVTNIFSPKPAGEPSLRCLYRGKASMIMCNVCERVRVCVCVHVCDCVGMHACTHFQTCESVLVCSSCSSQCKG